MKFQTIIQVCATAIFLLFVGMTSIMTAQRAHDDRRTISVTGEAKAYFAPNRALITIGVETEGKDPIDVKRENDERVQRLMTAIKDAGVKRKDVQTSNLNIQPVYEYKSGKRNFIKYTMRNTVTVTVRDLDNVSNIINYSIAKGGNVLNGLQFFVANAEKIRDSLRVEAVKVAKAKAVNIATAVDMQVTKPISIDANSGGGSPRPMMMRQNMVNSSMAEDASMSDTEVSGGQMVIKAYVSVIFEME